MTRYLFSHQRAARLPRLQSVRAFREIQGVIAAMVAARCEVISSAGQVIAATGLMRGEEVLRRIGQPFGADPGAAIRGAYGEARSSRSFGKVARLRDASGESVGYVLEEQGPSRSAGTRSDDVMVSVRCLQTGRYLMANRAFTSALGDPMEDEHGATGTLTDDVSIKGLTSCRVLAHRPARGSAFWVRVGDATFLVRRRLVSADGQLFSVQVSEDLSRELGYLEAIKFLVDALEESDTGVIGVDGSGDTVFENRAFREVEDGQRRVVKKAPEGDVIRRAGMLVIGQNRESGRDGASSDAIVQAVSTNLSHEFRTPLAGILGCAGILQDELTGEHLEFAEMIRASGERLLATLDGLLEVTELAAGTRSVSLSRFRPSDVIDDVLNESSPLAVGHLVCVNKMLPESRRSVIQDRSCVQFALTHVISNAIRHADCKNLSVRLSVDANEFQVTVQDDGSGMAAEFVPTATDLFATANEMEPGGAGIGLALTRRLVELVGGQLTIHSAAGEGTLVHMVFPRMDPPVEVRRA